jgi:hypothetical protein
LQKQGVGVGDKEANLGFNLGDDVFYKAEKKRIPWLLGLQFSSFLT